MKVALPWLNSEEFQLLAQEYNIVFENSPNNFNKLLAFLEKNNNIRFNIKIDTFNYEFDLEQLRYAKIVNPNIHIIITTYWPEDLELLKKLNIDFYLSSDYAANSFRNLEYLTTLGVSDVYIVDDLCYQLDKVRKFCDKNNIQLRFILDEIPSRNKNADEDPKTPYFVPEVINELDQYVDVFEFTENDSKAKLRTLYKIWFEKQEWRENLRNLYPQLKMDIPNQSLISDFINYKMTCGYKCAYGSSCRKCNQFLEIANIRYKKNIEYVPKKKEG